MLEARLVQNLIKLRLKMRKKVKNKSIHHPQTLIQTRTPSLNQAVAAVMTIHQIRPQLNLRKKTNLLGTSDWKERKVHPKVIVLLNAVPDLPHLPHHHHHHPLHLPLTLAAVAVMSLHCRVQIQIAIHHPDINPKPNILKNHTTPVVIKKAKKESIPAPQKVILLTTHEKEGEEALQASGIDVE